MLYKNGTSIYSPYPRPSPGTNNSTLIIFIEHRTELVILRRVRHVLTARRPSSRTTGVPFFKTQSLNIIHTNVYQRNPLETLPRTPRTHTRPEQSAERLCTPARYFRHTSQKRGKEKETEKKHARV